MKLRQRFLIKDGASPIRLCGLSLIACALFAAQSVAAKLPYCSDLYSNGVQTFGKNSYIQFDYNAHIVNSTSTELNTSRVENHPWSIRKSCGTDACDISGLTSPRPRDNRKLQTSATIEAIAPANKKITVGSENTNQFGLVKTSEWSTAVFSPMHNLYIIDQLEIGYKSSLRLPAGEYWVRNLTMEVESRIDVMGEGTVHLYVLSALQVPMNVKLNANTGNPSQLTIYASDTAEFHAGTQTYGFVRTGGELYLHHRAKISGGAIARLIDMRSESQVVYDSAAAQRLNFPKICRAAPVTEPGDTTPPEIVQILGSGDTTVRKIYFGAIVTDTGNNASGVASVSVRTAAGDFPMRVNGEVHDIELILNPGENLLQVVALDHAGNESTFTTYAHFISYPMFTNLSYPYTTETQPIVMTGEVHTYWPADKLTVLIADEAVTLTPVTEGVYRFEATIALDGWRNRFSIFAENPMGESSGQLLDVFYHPPAFYVTVDQHNQTTSADTITLTGTFGIPGEEFNTEIIGLIAVGDTIEGELPVAFEEINADLGRFSVEVPLAPGENLMSIRVLNTADEFPWESGVSITRISP